MDLKTAVAALRSDANIWDAAASDLDRPRNEISSLGLTGSDVSMYGVDRGIDKTYAEAQYALEDMLRQAAQNFHALAGALRHAADLYDQNEADSQQQLYRAAGH